MKLGGVVYRVPRPPGTRMLNRLVSSFVPRTKPGSRNETELKVHN